MVQLTDLAIGILVLVVAGFVGMMAYGLYKDATGKNPTDKK